VRRLPVLALASLPAHTRTAGTLGHLGLIYLATLIFVVGLMTGKAIWNSRRGRDVKRSTVVLRAGPGNVIDVVAKEVAKRSDREWRPDPGLNQLP
jgi:hypothetical protein